MSCDDAALFFAAVDPDGDSDGLDGRGPIWSATGLDRSYNSAVSSRCRRLATCVLCSITENAPSGIMQCSRGT